MKVGLTGPLRRGHVGGGSNARAPYVLGDAIDQVSGLCKLVVAGDASRAGAQAGQVLAPDHGSDEAVVTAGVCNSHVILDHPSRGCHALWKADGHLQRQFYTPSFHMCRSIRENPLL